MFLTCLLKSLSAWLPSACAAGVGAFCGALGAYYLACRKEKERKRAEYLCLLLVIYAHLRALYTLFSVPSSAVVKDADGAKVVEFDLPFPDLDISPEQLQTLMEISPDKQMPSALITVRHFLKSHSSRVEKFGSTVLPFEFVTQQAKQLKFMLLSVRTQYEQATNDAFPLGESARK